MTAPESRISALASAPAGDAAVSPAPGAVATKDASALESSMLHACLAQLADIGAAVQGLAAALGLTPERLAHSEALDRVELDTALSTEALSGLSPSTFTRWFAALGDDLRLDLRLTGSGTQESETACVLRNGRSPDAAFAVFAAASAQTASDDARVELRLALAKSQSLSLARELLAHRASSGPSSTPPDSAHVAIFYTSPAWHRLLSFAALADWERLGIVRNEDRTLVVLCDSAGYLAGPALEVLGAREPEEPRWLAVSPSAWRRLRDRAAETRSLRDEEGNWPDAPRVLTPAHLRVEVRSPGLEATAARLAGMSASLSAAYLASSVQPSPGGASLLRFSGARPATCVIAWQPPEPAGAASLTAADPAALPQLATWAYAHASPDKLAIARECLARELPAGREVPPAELGAAARGALEAAKANFVLYLRGNTEQYFRVRQQAIDAVAAYTASVRKSVGDLTGDVVDNVYRTVGLLAGVVIAALIQPALSPLVTKIAAALLTLYMVFVLAYLLPARERRFQLETADLDAHLAAMPELSVSERARLRAQPGPERDYFERYFRLSRGIYIALAALGLLLFLLLLWTPLGVHLLATPPATPTPTPTVR